jgi:hypothetical protein
LRKTPAWRISRPKPNYSLRDGENNVGAQRHGFSNYRVPTGDLFPGAYTFGYYTKPYVKPTLWWWQKSP